MKNIVIIESDKLFAEQIVNWFMTKGPKVDIVVFGNIADFMRELRDLKFDTLIMNRHVALMPKDDELGQMSADFPTIFKGDPKEVGERVIRYLYGNGRSSVSSLLYTEASFVSADLESQENVIVCTKSTLALIREILEVLRVIII